MTQKKTKRFIRKRIKESDKPQMGRPAEKLSGDDVIGRRIPRGQDKKWWTCTNWRDRGEEAEARVWVVREYEWSARCACGARMHRWKEYTLPPVSGHKLPAKCDACNDRVTGRDRVEVVGAVAVEPVSVSYTGLSLEDQSDKIMMVLYKPLKAGRTVDVVWEQYSREAVKDACTRLIHANIKPPADMAAFLGAGSNG